MTKRKTDKEFKQEVYSLVKDEYVFLEPYQGAMNKIKVRHEECGNVYKVTPSHFLNGSRCPYCSSKARKTNAQFEQEVFDLVGNEYTFLDIYVNNATKLKVKHNKCRNVYKVIPNNFLRGYRCPYCTSKDRRKTDEEFKQEVYDLVGDEYVFLDTYVNNITKLRVRHNVCGNVYKVHSYSFLEGSRCPYCAGLAKKTDKQFQHEIYSLVGDEYVFLDTYVNTKTKLRVKHKTCGNVYEVQPNSFLHGRRCPYCYGNAKKTDKEFKKEIHDLVGDEYVFLDTYVNSYTKIRVKHKTCGNVYEVTPNRFLSGHGCPYCNVPKGETIISKILDSLNLNYETQQTFDDLMDKTYLSYDFYIPDQNILIEYQGIQHYQPIDYFGGETAFKKQQKHDQMKLDYTKSHGYNLIAVPYTVDTFSKIKKYLIKHGLE